MIATSRFRRRLALGAALVLGAACAEERAGPAEPAPEAAAPEVASAPPPPGPGTDWPSYAAGAGIAVHVTAKPVAGDGAAWLEAGSGRQVSSASVQAARGPGGELDLGFQLLHFNDGYNGMLTVARSEGDEPTVRAAVKDWVLAMGQGTFASDLTNLRGELWLGTGDWADADELAWSFVLAGEGRGGELVTLRGGGTAPFRGGLSWATMSPEPAVIPSTR